MASGMKRDWSGVITILLYSLTAWPILKASKLFPALSEPLPLFIFGVVTLAFNFAFLRWLLPPRHDDVSNEVNRSTRGSFLYHVCGVFTWSSMIDLIFHLELEGGVSGFMDFYLRNGESYFDCGYGSWSLLLDMLYNAPMYLLMVYMMDNRMGCGRVVVWWSGTMIASLGTLQYGAFSPRWLDDMKPSTLMNLPYAILPPLYLIHLQCSGERQAIKAPPTSKKSFWMKVLDFVIVLIFIDQLIFNIIRSSAVVNPTSKLASIYISYEPYILESSAFGSAWSVFNFYISTPLHLLLCYGIFVPGQTWMLDASLFNAAVSTYGSVVHLLSQFHWKTPAEYQPTSENASIVILANLVAPTAAFLVVLKCFVWNPGFYNKDVAATRNKAD